MFTKPNYFLLIDGHALIYRAYHAFPGLTDPKGRLVNAVYGFTRILLKSIADFEPQYLAVAFDHPKPTKRHQDFADYKAHREAMPDDLQPQIAIIKEVVDALNIPKYEVEGYEADDLIGTLARLNEEANGERGVTVLVVTGDKDLLQLVGDHTQVFIPARGKFGKDKIYDELGVEEKMGVTPDQVIELKALMGDSSDNIPGVKGVGAKTALKLVNQFGDLEGVYKRVEEIEMAKKAGVKNDDPLLKGSLLDKLIADKDNAYMSRDLATIKLDAPISLDLEACRVKSYDRNAVAKLFEEKLAFNSLVKYLPEDEFEAGVQDALF